VFVFGLSVLYYLTNLFFSVNGNEPKKPKIDTTTFAYICYVKPANSCCNQKVIYIAVCCFLKGKSREVQIEMFCCAVHVHVVTVQFKNTNGTRSL